MLERLPLHGCKSLVRWQVFSAESRVRSSVFDTSRSDYGCALSMKIISENKSKQLRVRLCNCFFLLNLRLEDPQSWLRKKFGCDLIFDAEKCPKTGDFTIN